MDSLNTAGKTTEQASYAGGVRSDNIDKTGIAFARDVGRNEQLMLPVVASVKGDESVVNVDLSRKDVHKHKVTVSDIALKITETALDTVTIEPAHKCVKTAAIEPASLPVIDQSLIESTQVVKTALLMHYRPNSILSHAQPIARPVHGLQHSCRTAIWAVALLQQRKLHGDPQALAFPDHMVPLLVKACLFHDTGREGDGADTVEWERASADNLREHLRNCNVEQSLAWQCGEAICLKDNPRGCQHLPEAIQTLRSLLHDADTLDVMRVRTSFDMGRLECFAACQDDHQRQDWRLLAREVCQVIASQGDLCYPITLHDSATNREYFFSFCTASPCINTKKQWEHHPSPFSYQLFGIGKQSATIRELISPYTKHLAEPPEPSFSLAQLTPPGVDIKACQGSWPRGLYNDPINQQVYYIKPTSCELSAQNQRLMANLAGLLGIKVPESFVHQEQGHFYVVSPVPGKWQGKLKGGEATLRSLSPEQWARLLLINVIVGNENMVNSAWEGIELTPEGEPVMFHWDFAGLATRYPCPEKPEPAPEADDFSSMPVLLNKLRDPQAPPMNSLPIDNPCVDILAQLEDDLLGHTLKDILRQLDWQALDRLIEHSGFLPGDRSWLRQTIHDRIAWLTTCFPNSLEADERVSMAEYKAIEAAGIRGGWLPVKGRAIRGGQIGISQLLDANDQPITRMSLTLSREAGNKLADNLALERGLHCLARQVKYTNLALNPSRHADHYRDWRSDLTSLANECAGMAAQLTRDKTRWNEKDHKTIENTVMILQDIADKCRASLAADVPSIAELPTITTPLPKPRFPVRVSSRTGKKVEMKIQLAEFSHGFAKLTGQRVSYLNPEQMSIAGLTRQPVKAVELESTVCEGGSILFSPANLPEAQSFENQLTLTFLGHSKAVVEALFRELAGLGIDCERPGAADLEEQWLDALADFYGCLGDMNRAVASEINTPVNTRKKAFLKRLPNLIGKALRWKFHCRIRAGRLVHYRPGLPHGIGADPAGKFCPGHDITFGVMGQRNRSRIVTDCLENEAALTSFKRRSWIGMAPIWNISKRRMNNDTRYTFSRLQALAANSRQSGEAMCVRLASAALGRLDAQIYRDQSQVVLDLDAFARNQKIITQSTDDYHSVIRHSKLQETRFANPVSLPDELHTIEMSSPEGEELLRKLKKRFSHWPDGRPLEQIFPHSWPVLYQELTGKDSLFDQGIKSLVKVCGEQRIQLLFEQNPRLLTGKLDSLDGFKLEGRRYNLTGIDFSGCSMKGTVLQSLSFKKCKFNTGLLGSAIVENVFFCECSFAGQRFSSSILDNACFYPEDDQDGLVCESTRQLSRILYQSCVNQDNEFNLEQWLKVMLKSSLLCSSLTPLDGLSRDILRQHIDEISRTYPQQLCGIIYELIAINFKNNANAKNFVANNPEFYDHKIKDLKDVYFEFRTLFLKEGNYPGQQGNPFEKLFFLYRVARRDYSREAVLALMLNVINLVLFPESNDKYIEFGINANSADELCLQNIPESDNESTQNNPISCPKTDALPLDKMRRYRDYLCRNHLENYQGYIHQFWKECPQESKLTIAKHCLCHQSAAIGPLTTLEFITFLADRQDAPRLILSCLTEKKYGRLQKK
ncbi:hypothetical protein [Endozoicomonas sp. SESOKO1]|uniref:hypothetical protein n=1 Tax=Endozoicomonas sp. SESOKO1 TaxID=2828742 RepID=UPI002148655B|nr:hypothetical protein [Endozoicomonas sp. SESOKO1]